MSCIQEKPLENISDCQGSVRLSPDPNLSEALSLVAVMFHNPRLYRARFLLCTLTSPRRCSSSDHTYWWSPRGQCSPFLAAVAPYHAQRLFCLVQEGLWPPAPLVHAADQRSIAFPHFPTSDRQPHANPFRISSSLLRGCCAAQAPHGTSNPPQTAAAFEPYPW